MPRGFTDIYVYLTFQKLKAVNYYSVMFRVFTLKSGEEGGGVYSLTSVRKKTRNMIYDFLLYIFSKYQNCTIIVLTFIFSDDQMVTV